MNNKLEKDMTVIVRDVYPKAPKARPPITGVEFCTSRDYIGCTGIVLEALDEYVIVGFNLHHVSGAPMTSDLQAVFAVGMLEAI